MLTQCDHTEIGMRLVAWATDCRGQHWQGFKMMLCCKDCGCIHIGVNHERL